MPKRNIRGLYATFCCFDQTGMPSLFLSLALESQDRPLAAVNWAEKKRSLKIHTYKLVLTLLFFVFFNIGTEVAHAQVLPRDGYIAVVSKADRRKPGEQFTFANLRTQRPFVTFPSRNGEETTKVFEDDETIVLISVANLTGSTETFYLNKKRNRFTLIEVGVLEATATGVDFRPNASQAC